MANQSRKIAFIGGGNMASAIVGGLIRQGTPPANIQIIEPLEAQRATLRQAFGAEVHDAPGLTLAHAELVVWAIKPQTFKDAALQTRFHTKNALHLSVAAGIRSDSIARWLGTQRIVRSMPNTPALVGQGMTALFAREAVTEGDRAFVEQVIATTGEHVWLDDENHLDAVTALSGSGPAYVFYFIEAMVEAGIDMGLTRAQARKLAVGTFTGSSALAKASDEAPEVLRARVTSKGGTTYAAITSMEQDRVKMLFMRAIHAAKQRARELGDEFGAV
ncbi:MAG: pyrroline-5-carboxylate reductase [Comamonadaceae bacterium]|nr:MAG: pyrroline-5-carboxylate reductase [Comamonadaceae bacterium]